MTVDRKAGLAGRTVLMRASFEKGVSRELAALVARCTQAGARAAIIAGHGDPSDDVNPALSLARFAEPLAEAAGCPVVFINESVGAGAEAGIDRVGFGEAALLENLRFHPSRRRNAHSFAMKLSVLGDYFIDAGGPAARIDGWQAHLSALLPRPPRSEINPETPSETKEEV